MSDLHAAFLAALRAEPGESAHRHAFGDVLRDAGLWTFPHLLGLMYAEQENDGLRLLVADWFAGEGQGERAEFVREYIRLSALECKPAFRHKMRTCPKCVGIDALWDAITAATLGGCELLKGEGARMRGCSDFDYDDGRKITVGRGFISEIRCPLAAFLAHGPALAAAHPLERVVLTDRGAWQVGERFLWHGRDERWNLTHASHLPLAWMPADSRYQIGFSTPEDAHAWASRRAIAWARGVAVV